MYLIRKYSAHINRIMNADTMRSFGLAGVIAIAFLSVIGCFLARTGAPPMNGYPWDAPLLLDGAWRIAGGQAPHRDFYSHLGALPYYVTLLGMRLSTPGISAITYGTVCLMAGIVFTAFLVLLRRTSTPYVLIYCVFLGLLVVTPRPMGYPSDWNDYAMLYNRFGEAFMVLFSIMVFVSPRPGTERPMTERMDSVLMGLLLTCLWFIKLNYFVIGAVFLALGGALGFIGRARLVITLLSAAGFTALALALSHISLGEMIVDFRLMSAAQDLPGKLVRLSFNVVRQIWYLPILLLLAWEGGSGHISTGILSWLRQWLVPVAIFGGSLLIMTANRQLDEMPVLAVAALYVAECIRRQSASLKEEPSFCAGRNVWGLCLVLFFTMPITLSDIRTFLNLATVVTKKGIIESKVLASTNLKDFRFVANSTRSTDSYAYMEELEDGVLLLRRHPEASLHLVAPLFSNPYHVALAIPPAKGGAICLADNVINRRSHPPLKRLLGDATHLLASKETIQSIQDMYGAEWDALSWETVEATRHFTLFRLRPGERLTR